MFESDHSMQNCAVESQVVLLSRRARVKLVQGTHHQKEQRGNVVKDPTNWISNTQET